MRSIRFLFCAALAASLLVGCASKPAEDEVTIPTRGDSDPLVLRFANLRFSGNNGTCVWAAYYLARVQYEYCGAQISADEEHNYNVVIAKIRAYFIHTAKIPALPLNWMERQKVFIRNSVNDAGTEDRTKMCGAGTGPAQLLSQLTFSKRVSDDIIKQLDGKAEPLELSCQF